MALIVIVSFVEPLEETELYFEILYDSPSNFDSYLNNNFESSMFLICSILSSSPYI